MYRWIFCLLLSLWLIGVSPARAQETENVCEAAQVAEGDRLYGLAQFAGVIELLEPCLPEAFPEQSQQESAHRLVILSYYQLEDEDTADSWGLSLLRINRNYQVPTDDPNYFHHMIDAFRPKPWHRRWVWRAPIASILAGTAAFFIFRPEDPVPLKPLPPGPPN